MWCREKYKVYAWEDGGSAAWLDSEFMKPLNGKGEPVRLGESSQSNVQLSVIPAESPGEKSK